MRVSASMPSQRDRGSIDARLRRDRAGRPQLQPKRRQRRRRAGALQRIERQALAHCARAFRSSEGSLRIRSCSAVI
jgi:hypothetical protein